MVIEGGEVFVVLCERISQAFLRRHLPTGWELGGAYRS